MRARRQHGPQHKTRDALDWYILNVSAKWLMFDSYGNPPEFYGAVFTEFITTIVTSGSGTTANCKAIGPACADTTVYSTWVIEPADIA